MKILRSRVMENFSRAAERYDAHADFQHAQNQRVFAQARTQFPASARLVDIGCGTGQFAQMASAQAWQLFGVDIAHGMCRIAATRCTAIQADTVQLPLADASCDGVVSSLCLQWVAALPIAIGEIARVLKPGGRAIIASLGSGSLQELRASAAQAKLPLGLLPLLTVSEYTAAILAHGFEIEQFTQTADIRHYPTVSALLDSMRVIGAGDNFAARPRGLTGAKRWKSMVADYEKRKTPTGIPATWDCLFMQLRKPL